jgi:hypothetical protein
MMKLRRKMLAVLLLLSCVVNFGCMTPIWSPNADRRAKQLIYQSENLRHIPNIWERLWHLELPDLGTPYRTHGGVI